MHRHPAALICGLLIALVLAAPASAQDAAISAVSQDQYGDSADRSAVGGGEPSAGNAGGLPFTGLDLGVMAVVAVTIAGAGVLIRRSARDEGH